MSILEEIRTPEQVWQGTENIRLIQQYFRECSTEPERCPRIPEGAKAVLLPPDAPGNERLRGANQDIIQQLAHEGTNYVVWVVGDMRLAESVVSSPGETPIYR